MLYGFLFFFKDQLLPVDDWKSLGFLFFRGFLSFAFFFFFALLSSFFDLWKGS